MRGTTSSTGSPTRANTSAGGTSQRESFATACGAPWATSPTSVGPFRALRTPLRDAFASFAGPYVSIDVLLSWATSRFSSVEVDHVERRSGPSTYSFGKLASLALTMLTGFSTRPLRLASLLGLVSTFLGVVILVYVVVRLAIEGNPAPGFPFLASIIAIFSGTQLLTLGIIGEYLGRIHVRTMDQPAYAIREQISSDTTTDARA